MQITLHFGAHRTASTTLQRVLGASRDTLQAQGIAYWGPKRTRNGLFEGLTGQRETAMPWRQRRPGRSVGRVSMALDESWQNGARQLIVSEENMLGTMRRTLAFGALYPDAAERIARIAKAFGGRADQIGLCLRSYDHWWASALGFQMLRGGPLPTTDLIQTLLEQHRRWRDIVTELAAAFPNACIKVWTFEALAAQPEAILAGLLGPGLGRLRGTRDWHNASPTPAMLRQAVRDLGAKEDLISEQCGRFMPFTPSERAKLRGHYIADLAWLRDVAGEQIDYIDDLGHNPGVTVTEGTSDGEGYRRLARTGQG